MPSPEPRLMARIKRTSKYKYQAPPSKWFPVLFRRDSYPVCGNNNYYRLSDVAFGVEMQDGSVMELGA